MKHQVGEDTADRSDILKRNKIEDIPKRSTNLLYGIIVLLVGAVAFLVGWATADINIVLQ